MPDPDVFPAATNDTSGPVLAERPADPAAEATARLVRSVDGMTPEAWRAPSLLPGWTRSHVVAHLALNAEALAGVLDGAGRGEPVAMYPSSAQRDADIADLAAADRPALRDRFLASTTAYADAFASVPAEVWEESAFARTPGTQTRPVADVPAMRLREVEVHHVDLALGATPADWPQPFAVALVEAMVARRPTALPLRLEATDVDRTWHLGEGAPTTVRGTAADLGWWLCGRGAAGWATSLTNDDGVLPRIEEL